MKTYTIIGSVCSAVFLTVLISSFSSNKVRIIIGIAAVLIGCFVTFLNQLEETRVNPDTNKGRARRIKESISSLCDLILSERDEENVKQKMTYLSYRLKTEAGFIDNIVDENVKALQNELTEKYQGKLIRAQKVGFLSYMKVDKVELSGSRYYLVGNSVTSNKYGLSRSLSDWLLLDDSINIEVFESEEWFINDVSPLAKTLIREILDNSDLNG